MTSEKNSSQEPEVDPVEATFGKDKVHVAIHVKDESLDNFVSVKKIMDLTALDYREVTKYNYDFRSIPSTCLCGHKLNMYDLFYESWKQEAHDSDFIANYLSLPPVYYFQRDWEITCPVCDLKREYSTLYRYGDASKY